MVWASFVLVVLLVRVEDQLYLLAAAIALLLCVLALGFKNAEEPGSLTFPTGWIAKLAVVHLTALFTVSRFGTMPWCSYWFAWIIGLLPIGYLLGRQLTGQILLWPGLALVGLSVSIWACCQYLGGAERVNGPFRDFNSFGALLYVFLLPATAKYCDTRQSPIKRGVYFVGIGIGLLALFATYSRGAIGVMGLMELATLAVIWRTGIGVIRPAIQIGGLAVVCYAAIKLYQPEALSRSLDLAHDPSTLFRIMMWKSAWAAWLDHPLFGTGLGTYRLQYLYYRLPEETETSGDLAHNDYLQMLMEGGPALLILLLAWGVAALALSLKAWSAAAASQNARDQRFKAAVSFSMLTAAIGLFLHAGVNFIFYVAPLSLVAGLYIGNADGALIPDRRTRSLKTTIRPWFMTGVASLGIALIAGSLLLDWAASAILTPTKFTPFSTELSVAGKDPEERYRVAAFFSTLRPGNVSALQTQTVAATELAFVHKGSPLGSLWARLALDNGEAWLRASRQNPYAYQVLGQLLWRVPSARGEVGSLRPSEPEALLRLAVDRAPARPEGYRVLAAYLESEDRKAEALRVIWSAFTWSRIPLPSMETANYWNALLAEGRTLGAELTASANAAPETRRIAQDLQNFRPPAVGD